MKDFTKTEITKIARDEAKKTAKEEIDTCMSTMQSQVSDSATDIREVKEALLGNAEYGTPGLLKQIRPMIQWWNNFSQSPEGEPSKRKTLNEIIAFWKNAKWVFGIIVGLGVINVADLVKDIIAWIANRN